MSNLETQLETMIADLDRRIPLAHLRADLLANSSNEFEATSLESPRNDARLLRWNKVADFASQVAERLEDRREALNKTRALLEEQREDRARRLRYKRRTKV